MGYLDAINDCDNFPQCDFDNHALWQSSISRLWRFHIKGGGQKTYGFLTQATVERVPWTSDFRVDEASRTITLDPEDGTELVPARAAAAITKLLRRSQDKDSFVKLSNWPGEKFPVLGSPYALGIDRAIAPYFGIVSTGVQLTIFTRGSNGSIAGVWVARRGPNKPMYAGMLDNAVGGAVKMGESPFDNLVREAEEEIGIDAKAAVSGGAISWFNIKDERSGIGSGLVEPGVQYVYDLEVDEETVLQPAEQGIEWLRLLSVDHVKTALERREFKPSCACVMIDFFVRHGIINAENETDFVEIVTRLHRNLPLPTSYPLP